MIPSDARRPLAAPDAAVSIGSRRLHGVGLDLIIVTLGGTRAGSDGASTGGDRGQTYLLQHRGKKCGPRSCRVGGLERRAHG
jgi:hypothetical protein